METSSPAPTILVVEDERIVAHDLADLLAGFGYRTALAATADEAVARARTARPQLVLMDIRLTGSVDGITAAAQLRAEHDLAIVYLTAHADDQTLARAKATEPHAYLVKPFREAELRCTVEIALHKHATERAHREREHRLARARLEAAYGELATFGSAMAHDLRAPLRSVDRFSQALLEDHAATLAPTGLADLTRVRAAATRMSTLLDASLRLARVTSAPLERRRLDVSALAWSVVSELRAAEPDRAVDLELQADVTIDGDFGLVRVLLAELIGNAWKFGARQLAIGGEPRAGLAAVYVRDDGPGLDPRLAERLFAPFQRGPSAGAGAGIGLAIAHRIAQRHGGELAVDSAPGLGATFRFAW
jgi:signal transduction histidine kinase